jgi:plasmid stabilization system protein ParE
VIVEFDGDARAEYDESVDWYLERSPRTAARFIAEIDDAIRKIVADPQRFPRTYAGCQRCSLTSFPYSIVYYRQESKFVIVAVAHAKRRANYWRHRVPPSPP